MTSMIKKLGKKIIVFLLFRKRRRLKRECSVPTKALNVLGERDLVVPQREEISVLRNIKVFTGYRFVFSDGRLISAPWINIDGVIKLLKRPGVFRSLLLELLILRAPDKIESAFFFVSRHGHQVSAPNYAHFLLEDLPLLKFWMAGYRDTKLLIRSDPPAWVTDILSALGVEKDRCIINDAPLSVDHLIIFPKPIFSSHKYEKNVARFQTINLLKKKVLQDRKEEEQKIEEGKWIFIDRHSERRRKIENRNELLQVLSRFEFTIIEPSSYTFSEQVKMFSNSSLLLGQSGAALVNGCFMNPESFLIELNHGEIEEGPTCWQLMCNEFGLSYRTIYPINSVDDHDKDITVDLGALEKVLWSSVSAITLGN